MSYDHRYSDLKYLMGRFHQDWKEDYRSDIELLRSFAREESSELVQRVLANIRQFVRENSDPRQVDALFGEKWRAETPYRSANDAIKWLKEAAEVLNSALSPLSHSKGNAQEALRPNIAKYPGLYLLVCQFDSDGEKVVRSEGNLFRQF